MKIVVNSAMRMRHKILSGFPVSDSIANLWNKTGS